MTTISNGNYGNELVFAEPKIRLDGDLMYICQVESMYGYICMYQFMHAVL